MLPVLGVLLLCLQCVGYPSATPTLLLLQRHDEQEGRTKWADNRAREVQKRLGLYKGNNNNDSRPTPTQTPSNELFVWRGGGSEIFDPPPQSRTTHPDPHPST